MATRQKVKSCKLCEKVTIHIGPSTSHVLHFLISVVTIGWWVIVWFFLSIRNKFKLRCSECGN